jgi:hypothetical protein
MPDFGLDNLATFLRNSTVMKTTLPLYVTALVLVCLSAAAPTAPAVSPPPDGGYPGGNTAEGQAALLSLSSGGFNTAVGYVSLRSDTAGSFNTAVGAGALLANTAGQNTAIGAGALLSNTTASYNTAIGTFALSTNTEGGYNTATGNGALLSNTTGIENTAIGASALANNTSGGDNTAIGRSALSSNTNGQLNTAMGATALANSTINQFNTAIGACALCNTTGDNNTAVGYAAGANLTTGDNNIDIGYNVLGVAGESNTIRIGNTDITTTIIRGISGATIASGAPVLVASNGQLGTMTSSKRFKQEIKPMDEASEALYSLKPVTFRYKKQIDPAGIQQFGLVAEDVEKVNPDLALRDESGKANSVRYDQVNAMLLNEFLKEHWKVENQDCQIEQQEAAIVQLKNEIAGLAATVKEQNAQIQKVTAQIALTRSATKLAETGQ